MAEEEPTPESAYDELADSYDEAVREGPYNADLEFPATASLVPEVAGKRVLDAGCGTGVYTAWLAERGATVVGVDVSGEMLARAQERTGGDVSLRQADLRDGLAFADSDSFDGVVSALTLGYVADWTEPLSAFARVLRPGGFLVLSTGHPLDQFPFEADNGAANYFETERQRHEWAVDVPYYRRPFSAVINPLLEAGFRLESVVEPQPTAEFERRRPELYERESRHPVFLCVRATRV
ncbi:MAG: methylase involved in ubiquinone/menaquinone biosynthesis [halophilic archaeon J07HX64]|jgi:Methylase involved in ubiquinone/menaquinone biosynthesis|nr:MAG: methylase involved in ubiquinone/menaquinone biosynthesis [halophilic archaeon J07HX64]